MRCCLLGLLEFVFEFGREVGFGGEGNDGGVRGGGLESIKASWRFFSEAGERAGWDLEGAVLYCRGRVVSGILGDGFSEHYRRVCIRYLDGLETETDEFDNRRVEV